MGDAKQTALCTGGDGPSNAKSNANVGGPDLQTAYKWLHFLIDSTSSQATSQSSKANADGPGPCRRRPSAQPDLAMPATNVEEAKRAVLCDGSEKPRCAMAKTGRSPQKEAESDRE